VLFGSHVDWGNMIMFWVLTTTLYGCHFIPWYSIVHLILCTAIILMLIVFSYIYHFNSIVWLLIYWFFTSFVWTCDIMFCMCMLYCVCCYNVVYCSIVLLLYCVCVVLFILLARGDVHGLLSELNNQSISWDATWLCSVFVDWEICYFVPPHYFPPYTVN